LIKKKVFFKPRSGGGRETPRNAEERDKKIKEIGFGPRPVFL
jgi:hypothetical protein